MSLYWELLRRDVSCDGVLFVDPEISVRLCRYFALDKLEELTETLQTLCGQ